LMIYCHQVRKVQILRTHHNYDSKCIAASSIWLESVLKNRSHNVGVLIHAANGIRKLKLKALVILVSNATQRIVSLIFMNQLI
uniref:Uncharacterized protein n=1 Tax=Amphimedon queenslandica TaxID=400682 RepID=A0A1X7T6I5_AMPQE